MLISIDPGAKLAGVATFEDGELTCAWLARPKGDNIGWRETAFETYRTLLDRFPVQVLIDAEVAIERPQIYHPKFLRGDPNDLVTLALMAGGIVTLLGQSVSVTEYYPKQWKGQVKKEAMVERVKERVAENGWTDRVELPTRAKKLAHNIFDAIGIGLKHLKRL